MIRPYCWNYDLFPICTGTCPASSPTVVHVTTLLQLQLLWTGNLSMGLPGTLQPRQWIFFGCDFLKCCFLTLLMYGHQKHLIFYPFWFWFRLLKQHGLLLGQELHSVSPGSQSKRKSCFIFRFIQQCNLWLPKPRAWTRLTAPLWGFCFQQLHTARMSPFAWWSPSGPDVAETKQSILKSGWWVQASSSGWALSPCSSGAGNYKRALHLWNTFLSSLRPRAVLALGEWSRSTHDKKLPPVSLYVRCVWHSTAFPK